MHTNNEQNKATVETYGDPVNFNYEGKFNVDEDGLNIIICWAHWLQSLPAKSIYDLLNLAEGTLEYLWDKDWETN